MEKLEYCRVCGQQVSSKAKKCPHCGAKLKRRHILLKIILGIIILGLISSVMNNLFSPGKNNQTTVSSSKKTNQDASRGYNTKPETAVQPTAKPTPKPTAKPTKKPTQKPTAKPTPTPLAGIGDKIEEDGVSVTLSNVLEITNGPYYSPKEGNVFILCEFIIENNTSEDIVVSSMMSFSFYYDGFSAPISVEALTAKGSANQLDGAVAAGKKFKGVVGYEIPKDWKQLEVSFRPDVFYSSSFEYQIEREDVKR